MKGKTIILTLVLILFLLTTPTPTAQETQKDEYEAVILTRQEKGAFVASVEDGKMVFKNWTVKMYSWKEGKHEFKLVVNGDEKLSGTFDGYRHEKSVKLSISKHSNVVLEFDGTTFEWNNVRITRKRVGRDDILQSGGGSKKITKKAWSYVLNNLGHVIVGAIAAIGAILVMRVYVQRKKESNILEGF